MRTRILFFDREGLTDLFADLTSVLSNEYDIAHVVLGENENRILAEYGIKSIANLTDFVQSCVEGSYSFRNNIYNIERFLIEFSENKFTVNMAIQSDRTLMNLPYDEAIFLVKCYYEFWDIVFSEDRFDFVFHETTTLTMNLICSCFAKKYDAIYSGFVGSIIPGTFTIVSFDSGRMIELEKNFRGKLTSTSIEMARDFLATFRKNHVSTEWRTDKISYLKLTLSALKKSLMNKFNNTKRYLENPIKNYHYNTNYSATRLKNLMSYKLKKIHWNKIDYEKDYYFYAFHFEPEAVVLYWGGGWYENQTKLIQNIAAQLPVGTYLYVKDHPGYIGYRDWKDYSNLVRIPNIKLIDPSIPAVRIIEKSRGVFTINGTVGLEAILFNRQVFTFGHAYYNISSRVKYIENIKDLRSKLIEAREKDYEDDFELFRFVNAYISSVHEGIILGGVQPFNRAKNTTENTEKIASGIHKFINAVRDLKEELK